MRIAAVSYLNTLPMLEGLRRSGMDKSCEIILAPPSECARLFVEKEVDIALCPVAVLAEPNTYHMVSAYCIGTTGKVRTVMLFSDSPVREIGRIFLDNESRTSNILVQILCDGYWKITPEFVLGQSPEILKPGEAKLSIGDKCFGLEKQYRFHYDLGEAWAAHTGFHFVFACWLSHKPLSTDFEQQLNHAFETGLAMIPSINYSGKTDLKDVDYLYYLTQNISFNFDVRKRRGLEKFLELTIRTKNQAYAIENPS